MSDVTSTTSYKGGDTVSTFYDPSVTTTKEVPAATRPMSLEGKVIGLYDNTKEQADVILEAVGEKLMQSFGVKETLNFRGVHYSKPAPLATIEEMARKCDIVICALGG
jgi:hypothetical protein